MGGTEKMDISVVHLERYFTFNFVDLMRFVQANSNFLLRLLQISVQKFFCAKRLSIIYGDRQGPLSKGTRCSERIPSLTLPFGIDTSPIILTLIFD